MNRICLFTATGAENLGDELITLCEVRFFQSIFPAIHITIFSHSVERTKRFFLSQKVPLENIHLKEYFPNNIRKHPLKNIYFLWHTIQSIRKSDHVYIGGGGLLYGENEEGHSPLKLWWMRAIMVKFFHKPLTYLSLGISASILELQPYLRGILKGAHVTVRDIKSKKILEQENYIATLLPDPVFTYEGKKSTSRTIGIALRKGFLDDETVKETVKGLLSLGYEVILLPHSLHPTDELSHDGYYLQDFLLPGVTTTQSIEQTLEGYKKCHIIISMRLHSMILAIDHSIPFIGISYSQKTSELLEEMSWNYRCDTSVNSTDIVDSVQKMESEYTPLTEQLNSFHKKTSSNYNHILSTIIGK